MKPNQPTQSDRVIMWTIGLVPVLWLCSFLASHYTPGMALPEILHIMTDANQSFFNLTWTVYTPKFLIIGAVGYSLALWCYHSLRHNYRSGEEHGSAVWGNVSTIAKKYGNRKKPMENLIMTKYSRLSFETKRHRRNLNTFIIGGSGSGKTRFFCKPNLMNANSSYLVCDPKGEMLRATGHLLLSKGYDLKVIDLIDFGGDCYNPFYYLTSDTDVFKLISNLIRNTTPPNATNNDPFWEKSETALLSALMLYLWYEAPEYEQNFGTLMYLIENGGASEEDESYVSPLDILFSDLEMESPEHIAVKQYKIFQQAAAKTAKSILLSAAVRLSVFNLEKVQAITNRDDVDIGSLGEKKKAIFALVPDNDDTYNFMIGMLYTQAFQALYHRADRQYGGSLPIPVHFIMDEFCNTGNLSPDDFLRVLATMRSRSIFCSIIIQNIALLKKNYKETWEALPGTCDNILYLGGNEHSTHEYISKMLGKSTIDTRTSGETRGKSGSSSRNFQNAGRELMTPDEVRKLDNDLAIYFMRGEAPILDRKYNILKHPNIKLTEDGGMPSYFHERITPVEKPLFIRLEQIDGYEFL